MKKIQLGVIFGSRSCEHEVSIISALQLMRAVDLSRYDVIPIYISQRGEWYTGEVLKEMSTYTPFNENRNDITFVQLDNVTGSNALMTIKRKTGIFGGDKQEIVAYLDCVIPVMHGMHGEDGTLQGLLEMSDIPYASSGVGACSIGMDKVFMKQFFKGCGFPVLPSLWFIRTVWQEDNNMVVEQIESSLPYPVYVKPASLGSSIGVSCANNREELIDALELGFEFDRKVMVEQGLVNNIELNCSVLGYNQKLSVSPIEMPISEGAVLDFVQKYGNQSSKGMASLKRVLPAPIEDDLTKKIQNLSKQIFTEMDCKGVVRIDFMYSVDKKELYITEINTIPGSLSFYLWEKAGVSYSQLIDKMVECAMAAKEDKENSTFAFTSDILKNMSLGKAGAKSGAKIM